MNAIEILKIQQEIIKREWFKAYGSVPNLSGMCLVGYECNSMANWFGDNGLDIDLFNVEHDADGIFSIHPKSLEGLWDNNGWTIYEGYDKLPKEEAYYEMVDRAANISVVSVCDLMRAASNATLTHYRKYEPKLPFY